MFIAVLMQIVRCPAHFFKAERGGINILIHAILKKKKLTPQDNSNGAEDKARKKLRAPGRSSGSRDGYQQRSHIRVQQAQWAEK